MAQKGESAVAMTATEETTDHEFVAVESRKKKREKKRKARRVTESDSDTVTGQEEEAAKKVKRKKVSKTVKQESTPEKADRPTSVKDRSKVVFQDILSFVTNAGLDAEVIRKVLHSFAQMQELLNEALMHNSNLEGKLECMRADLAEHGRIIAKKVEEKLQEAVPTGKPLTYAERVGVKAKTVPSAVVREPRNIVTVFPKGNDSLKSSEDVKQAVKKLISPREEGIGIRNVRKIHGNGIIIETDKKCDLDCLIANKKLKEAGIEVGLPTRKNPRIIIYGVPRCKNDEELLKHIVQHNFEEELRDKVLKGLKLAFKTGDKSKDKCNLVLEATREVRAILMKRERIYVEWECCRLQDFVAATRCFKCQSYGHITKHCRSEKEHCGHCAEAGHSFKDCKKKEKPAVCVNCKRAGKPANHSVKDKECFALKAATQLVISRTDYGQ